MQEKITVLDEKMYDGFPYTTFIHPVVRNNLVLRQRTGSRLNNKVAWVKLTSGLWRVNSNNNDTDYTSMNSFFNKGDMSYSFDKLYNTSEGNIPIAGIENIEVKYLSKFGGVREATINWKAYSVKQFEEVSSYFSIPGISLLLEWGWTSDLSTYDLNKSEYYKIKDNITESWIFFNNLSYESSCNYDAMHGIIKDFSFNIENGEVYSCSTVIISGASLMYGLNIRNQSATKTEKDKTLDLYDKSIKGFVKNKLENFISLHYKKQFPKSSFQIFGESLKNAVKYIMKPIDYIAYESIENVKQNLEKIEIQRNYEFINQDDVKIYNDAINGGTEGNIYVTWGFIEEVIVNKNLSVLLKNNNKPLYKLSSKDISINNNNEEPSIRISNDRYLRSTDLNICIIPQTEDEGSVKSIEGITFNPDFFSTTNYMTKDNKYSHGFVRNIFVHIDVVKDAFETSDFLTDALLKILNRISEACGNMWNFSLKIRESDQTMIVIDENYTDVKLSEVLDQQSSNVYKFSYYGGNSIIKSISFDCSIPTSMVMTALYSHHSEDNTAINSINNTIRSFFADKEIQFIDKLFPELSSDKDGTTISDIQDIKSLKDVSLRSDKKHNGFSNFIKRFLPEDGWIKTENNNKIKDNNITHEMAMKIKMLDNSKNDLNSQLNDIIIPGTVDLSIEGISGLRIGDVFIVDFLPDVYIKNILFQITSVDHSVDNSGNWSTTISSSMRLLNTKLDIKEVVSYKNKTTNLIQNYNNNVINTDKSVLKWIKNKMGPVLKRHSTNIFTEDILAGIINTETGGIIKKLYKNGTEEPNNIIKNKALIGDNNNAFGFFQIHKNTEKIWIESDGKPNPTWSSINESTKKAVNILNDKMSILSNKLNLYDINIQHASISAYNQGQSRVIKNVQNGFEPDMGNPNNYLNKVLEYAKKYREL